jgi:hypothetical protein
VLRNGNGFPSAQNELIFEISMFFGFQGYVMWIIVAFGVAAVVLVAFKRRVWAAVAVISALPWTALFAFGPRTQSGDHTLGVIAVALLLAVIAIAALRRAGYGIHITKV